MGNMDQHTDSRGEHRAVDDDAVPAVEAEMSEDETELRRRASVARNTLRRMCEDDPYLVITELEDAVRTLARAPLEERIRELVALLGAWDQANDGFTAENAKLREALTPFAGLMSQSWEERQDEHPVYSFDGKAFTYGDVRRAVRLLATSSTEATE